MYAWLWFAIAILCLILVPFAPQLVRLRIRFLRWLRWSWAVDLLESHFQRWVVFFRIILLLVAVLLLIVGFRVRL